MSDSKDLPVARELPRRCWTGRLIWGLPLLTLAVSIGLVVWQHGDSGPTISIGFPEAHGLQEGDGLKHRGVEVGRVTAVRLARTARNEVEVHAFKIRVMTLRAEYERTLRLLRGEVEGEFDILEDDVEPAEAPVAEVVEAAEVADDELAQADKTEMRRQAA